MSLPILQVTSEPSPADLVRFFHRTELHYSRHAAEEHALDAGAAMINAELTRVHNSNRIFDAFVPEGFSAQDVVIDVNRLYAENGSKCRKWILNPSAPSAQTQPLADHLLSLGYATEIDHILYLARAPNRVQEVSGLTIIPARSSFKHARQLAEESAARWNEPQVVEASMLHLDDPHYDALIALKGGKAAARVGVLAVGDIGRIEPLFVSEPFRRQGVGRTMMSRALEICARSLFKHVFISVAPDNGPAYALYTQLGFRKIGEFVQYSAPE